MAEKMYWAKEKNRAWHLWREGADTASVCGDEVRPETEPKEWAQATGMPPKGEESEVCQSCGVVEELPAAAWRAQADPDGSAWLKVSTVPNWHVAVGSDAKKTKCGERLPALAKASRQQIAAVVLAASPEELGDVCVECKESGASAAVLLLAALEEAPTKAAAKDKPKAGKRGAPKMPDVLWTGTEQLPVILTETELLDLGQQLAQVESERRAHEEHASSVKANLKAREAELVARQAQVASVIRAKRDYRDVSVETKADYRRGVAQTTRLDTYQLVRERALTTEERQGSLGLEHLGNVSEDAAA